MLTRYFNLRLFVLVLLFFSIEQATSQNIYDAPHSERYANHLFKSKEFGRAAIEYERVCFLDSLNWNAQFKLIQSYRKSAQPSYAVQHWNKIRFKLPLDLVPKFEHEINRSLFEVNPLSFATCSRKDSVMDLEYFKIPSLLLTHNWKEATTYITIFNFGEDKTLTNYYEISVKGLALNYKKPWVAGTLSAIVPGLGKAYTGYYKDGILSLLATGVSAYQAYRGYKAKGVKSGIFIVYSGLTTGFYLGNIYGSVKSAHKKNKKLNAAMDSKTKAVFYDWAD